MNQTPPGSRTAAGGFTLIEVLVALLILGIMSALGYGTYRAARIAADRTEESLQRSREIEFGMRMLVMDFAQMAPRPVRDPLGQTRLPALRGSAGSTGSTGSAGSTGSGGNFGNAGFGGDALVDLTRAGWSNTAGQQRSTLQRVSYALVDNVLKRSYQTALDAMQGNKPVVQDLFTGVKTIQLRYLDSNRSWQNQWPPSIIALPQSLWTRPLAVEISIEFKDWGRIRRLVEVAG